MRKIQVLRKVIRASIYAPQYFYIATPHKTPLNAFATVLKAIM